AHLKDGAATLVPEEIARIEGRFTRPNYLRLPATDARFEAALATDRAFANWHKRNVHPHKKAGYAAVTLSLKKTGVPPGDVTVEQMEKIDDLDYLHDIGEIDVNISGCMNACGHHHVGHIGILGVDKSGEEWYQIEIGGNQGEIRPGRGASLGKVIGPSFARAEVPDVIEKLIECYLARRDSDAERFIDVVHRVGIEPFKESVYGNADQRAAHRRGQLASA